MNNNQIFIYWGDVPTQPTGSTKELITNESDDEDNEGSDFYTKDELDALRDWDTTLMDGLEDLDNDNE